MSSLSFVPQDLESSGVAMSPDKHKRVGPIGRPNKTLHHLHLLWWKVHIVWFGAGQLSSAVTSANKVKRQNSEETEGQ